MESRTLQDAEDALQRSRAMWRNFEAEFGAQATERVRSELVALRAEIDGEIARIDGMRRMLSEIEQSGSRNGMAKPNKTEAILLILAERAESILHLTDIHKALVERGWYEPGEKAYHQLQTNIAKLVGRDQIARVDKGMYRITPAGLAAR